MNPAWTVRVSSTRDGSAGVRARKHGFAIGQPLDFGGDAAGPSALEALLGALGADLLLRFRDLCDRRRLPLDQCEARVDGRLGNAMVALGVIGEEGDPALTQASVTLSIASPAAESALQSVWQQVLAASPLVATLRKSTDLDLDLQLL
ncbi:MAG: hypothetical protein HONBIEJF_02002 [Fimbriimonadaceae bacterium]|nr:hypothetical protein [Fimbriimonadaceae bacterium]